MLNEKQKADLEKVVESLRGKGMETFEEMILFQAAMIRQAAGTLQDRDKQLKQCEEALAMNQEENKKLMEELRASKEQCQKYAAKRIWESDPMDKAAEMGGDIEPYYQNSTITFNGDPKIDTIEIYYRKDR